MSTADFSNVSLTTGHTRDRVSVQYQSIHLFTHTKLPLQRGLSWV